MGDKGEYVRLLCDEYVCGGIRTETQLVLQGFHDIIDGKSLQSMKISLSDLSQLICGCPSYDVREWERFTLSNAGDNPEKLKAKDWFFQVLRESDDALRGKLLHFTTGS